MRNMGVRNNYGNIDKDVITEYSQSNLTRKTN
jgi:hypothetical protein